MRASRALPIDAPERRRLPVLLRRAWYGLNQAFRRRLLSLGLTPDQFTVLRTLLENPGISQRRLAELMSSDANTIAALVERMEKMELLARQTGERDRRANILRVKTSGKTKYQAARQVALKLQSEVLGVLRASSRERFLKELTTVAEACQAAAELSPKASRKGTQRTQRSLEI